MTAPAWISVKERLPEIGERVLFWADPGFAEREMVVGCWDGVAWETGAETFFNDEGHEQVSHWMPLPPPPEAGT